MFIGRQGLRDAFEALVVQQRAQEVEECRQRVATAVLAAAAEGSLVTALVASVATSSGCDQGGGRAGGSGRGEEDGGGNGSGSEEEEEADGSEAADGMELFVKLPSGATITLKVEGSNTIASVKSQIQGREGFFPRHQRLIFAGKKDKEQRQKEVQLDDDSSSLDDYGIDGGRTVRLSLQLKGGAKRVITAMTKPTRTEQLENLHAKFKKQHAQHVNVSCYDTLMVALQESEAVMSGLVSNPEYLKQQMYLMPIDSLLNLADSIGSTSGEGGALRKVPQLVQLIIPQIVTLSECQSFVKEISEKINETASIAFASLFHAVKNDLSEQVPAPTFVFLSVPTSRRFQFQLLAVSSSNFSAFQFQMFGTDRRSPPVTALFCQFQVFPFPVPLFPVSSSTFPRFQFQTSGTDPSGLRGLCGVPAVRPAGHRRQGQESGQV